jgi:TatD DNase family protein
MFERDLDAVLARAREAGIDRILTVGTDLASSLRSVSLAQQYDILYAAVGVHPHEATRFRAEGESVRALLDEPKVVAIGEIGLDYYRSAAPRTEQLLAFREQVRWATDRDLPVSVHNRSADSDVLGVLSTSGARTVLHCFSGSEDFAHRALNAGFSLSFAGNLTFPKAAELRKVAANVPADKLLVETDAPALAPQIRRGKRNEPSLLLVTVEALASLRSVAPRSLSEQLNRNADELFAWRRT